MALTDYQLAKRIIPSTATAQERSECLGFLQSLSKPELRKLADTYRKPSRKKKTTPRPSR